MLCGIIEEFVISIITESKPASQSGSIDYKVIVVVS